MRGRTHRDRQREAAQPRDADLMEQVEMLRNTLTEARQRNRALEREVADRPTAWAYQQACKALDHWRAEAKRLADLAGVEPRQMGQQ